MNGGKRWHAEDGVLGVWSKSAWGIVYERPFTVVAIVIALAAVSRPQVTHVISGFLGPTEVRERLAAIVYGAGVIVLLAAAVCGMVLVIPADRALSDDELAGLPWARRAVARVARRISRMLFLVNRYTAIDLWLHEREARAANGQAPRRSTGRWLIGVTFVVGAVGVWLWGALGDGACRWAAVTRRLLPAIGLGLSAAWFLVGYEDPAGPRRRALGRYALMTFVGLATGELLWCLPKHGHGQFSYRFYTIWAILFLLFVIVATGRLIDRTALRARVLLVVMVFVVTRLTSGFAVDTRAVAGEQAIAQAHAREGGEWFARLETRIKDGNPSGPVILVAASGGGSRAAMFASLVYEYLDHVSFDGTPVAAGQSAMGRNVALMSGVSGGSLATAYYLARDDSGRRFPARNFTADEVATGIRSIANRYVTRGSCPAPDNKIGSERYARACTRVAKEVKGLPTHGPTIAPWLLESGFVDDMATDFMAPLLRGVLTPFLERGHSVADFWAEQFGWSRKTQHSCLSSSSTASPSSPAPGTGAGGCDWKKLSPPAPLAMLNATNVADGGRIIIGYPPVPAGLLGPGAVSLSDVGGAHDLSLADGVRLSANFPWGFEIGLFSPVPYTFLLPDAIKLTDGGVADNSGLDSIAAMLESLEARSKPPNTDAVPKAGTVEAAYVKEARAVRDLLVGRGVMLVEIDSGARPERSTVLDALVPAVTEPMDAMSMAGFGGTTTIKAGHLARIRDALDAMARQSGDGLSPAAGRPFQHLPFVCNYADTIMTAWALGPEDKAALMARFLVEAEASSVALHAGTQDAGFQKDLAVLARIKVGLVSAQKPRAAKNVAAESRLATNVIEDLRAGETARTREDSTTFAPQPSDDDGRLAPSRTAASRAGAAGASPTTAGRQGWIYLGNWDDETNRWVTSYLLMNGVALPGPASGALKANTPLTASGRVNVRERMPDPEATFGNVEAVLQPGSTIRLADAAKRWQDTGFYWALINY
jgi:hypothetical protein